MNATRPSSPFTEEAAMTQPNASLSPPVPHRRLVSVVVWLGVVLLLGSAALVGLTLHSHAQDPSPGPSPSPPPAREHRAVAVAYVDVEAGVTNLYPVKPVRVAQVRLREGQTG